MGDAITLNRGSNCQNLIQMRDHRIDFLRFLGTMTVILAHVAAPNFIQNIRSFDVILLCIGAATHSYDIKTRSWNVSDINEYIESIENGVIPMEMEIIDDDTRYNDAITTSLRTSEGIDMQKFSVKHRNYCLANAKQFINQELLELKDNRLRITRKGIFVSDYIMSELIYID